MAKQVWQANDGTICETQDEAACRDRRHDFVEYFAAKRPNHIDANHMADWLAEHRKAVLVYLLGTERSTPAPLGGPEYPAGATVRALGVHLDDSA